MQDGVRLLDGHCNMDDCGMGDCMLCIAEWPLQVDMEMHDSMQHVFAWSVLAWHGVGGSIMTLDWGHAFLFMMCFLHAAECKFHGCTHSPTSIKFVSFDIEAVCTATRKVMALTHSYSITILCKQCSAAKATNTRTNDYIVCFMAPIPPVCAS